MYTGYQIYQAERPRSAAEQRQVDIAHAELARAVSRGWHTLTAPLRALRARRQGRRQPGLAPRLAPEYQAAEGLATEGLATEGLATEGLAAECLSGRTA